MLLRAKAKEYALQLGFDKFKASPGWIFNTLKLHGMNSVNLHGEASDVPDEEREKIMDRCRSNWPILSEIA